MGTLIQTVLWCFSFLLILMKIWYNCYSKISTLLFWWIYFSLNKQVISQNRCSILKKLNGPFKITKPSFLANLISIMEYWPKWITNKIYRPRLRPNYLSKFVCTQWAAWLVYSSSWIVVCWKFYSLTNSNALSVYTNLCTVLTSDDKSILLYCLI